MKKRFITSLLLSAAFLSAVSSGYAAKSLKVGGDAVIHHTDFQTSDNWVINAPLTISVGQGSSAHCNIQKTIVNLGYIWFQTDGPSGIDYLDIGQGIDSGYTCGQIAVGAGTAAPPENPHHPQAKSEPVTDTFTLINDGTHYIDTSPHNSKLSIVVDKK